MAIRSGSSSRTQGPVDDVAVEARVRIEKRRDLGEPKHSEIMAATFDWPKHVHDDTVGRHKRLELHAVLALVVIVHGPLLDAA